MAARGYQPFAQLFEVPLRNGLTKPKAVRGEGLKMVNMGEVFACSRIHNIEMDRVPVDDKERANSLLRAGDLLFARQSLVLSGAGKCVLFQGDEEDVVFESHIIRCRLDQSRASPEFYFYLFQSGVGRSLIESIVEQVAAAGIRGSDLGRLAVPVPPLAEQKAIASVLGALDDKIELNRRMNATLEAMARALFQSWFVDFDPVRAKLDGRQPASLDADVAALFPKNLQDSLFGLIPHGWLVVPLRELTSYLSRGISPIYSNANGVRVLNQKCVRDHRVDFARARSHDNTKKSIEGKSLRFLDVLVNSTGEGTLGRVAQVLQQPGQTVVDSHVTVVRYAEDVDPYFLGIALTQKESDIEALAEGSTGQTELSRTRLGSLLMIRPSKDLQQAFGIAVKPMLETIANNDSQSRTLATLRDTLLPKLLSGELRLPTSTAYAAIRGAICADESDSKFAAAVEALT